LFGVQIEAVWLPRLLLHLVIMTPQTHEVFDFLGISGHNHGLGWIPATVLAQEQPEPPCLTAVRIVAGLTGTDRENH
jgi:hypothetical protein